MNIIAFGQSVLFRLFIAHGFDLPMQYRRVTYTPAFVHEWDDVNRYCGGRKPSSLAVGVSYSLLRSV